MLFRSKTAEVDAADTEEERRAAEEHATRSLENARRHMHEALQLEQVSSLEQVMTSLATTSAAMGRGLQQVADSIEGTAAAMRRTDARIDALVEQQASGLEAMQAELAKTNALLQVLTRRLPRRLASQTSQV